MAAGGAAAAAALQPGRAEDALDGYAAGIRATLGAEMATGRRLLAAFSRHPGLFHAALASPLGWRAFQAFCRGELAFDTVASRRLVRAGLRLLG
jgi:hypothetical protein